MPDQTMQNRNPMHWEREREREREREGERERNYAWTIVFQFNLGHG